MPPMKFSKDGRKAKNPKKTLLRLITSMKHYIPNLVAVLVCIVISAIRTVLIFSFPLLNSFEKKGAFPFMEITPL